MGTKNYKVYIPPAILAVFFCNAIISTVNQISLSCLSGSLVCTTLHLLAMSPFLFPIAFAFVVTAIAFVAQKVLVQVTREGKRSVDTALVSLALFLGAVLASIHSGVSNQFPSGWRRTFCKMVAIGSDTDFHLICCSHRPMEE
jgi:hypothetical protein